MFICSCLEAKSDSSQCCNRWSAAVLLELNGHMPLLLQLVSFCFFVVTNVRHYILENGGTVILY